MNTTKSTTKSSDVARGYRLVATTFRQIEPGRAFYHSPSQLGNVFVKLADPLPKCELICDACKSTVWEAHNITCRPWTVHFCPNCVVYKIEVRTDRD